MKIRTSCEFCYVGHRKCDHQMPSCSECKKSGVICKYESMPNVNTALSLNNMTQRPLYTTLKHKMDHHCLTFEKAIYNIRVKYSISEANTNTLHIVLVSSGYWRKYIRQYVKTSII